MFQPQIISACCYKYFAVKKQETLHNIRQKSVVYLPMCFRSLKVVYQDCWLALTPSNTLSSHVDTVCNGFARLGWKKWRILYAHKKMRVILLKDCKIIYPNNNIPYDFQNFSNFDLVFKNFENYCGTCSLITMFLLLKQITFYRLWPIQD